MLRLTSRPLVALIVCTAGLLAATTQVRPEGWSVIAVYAYWLVRISIEAALFIAFFQLLSLIPAISGKALAVSAGAFLASLVPFVLSVTTMDIILGLPELGEIAGADWTPDLRLGAFLRELGYLADNHAFLCALLSIPILDRTYARSAETSPPRAAILAPANPGNTQPARQITFLESLSPPFSPPLIRAEAQEHYVKLVGTTETRMVLYRFSDLLRELPETLGMQVHRSHWVSTDAIRRVYQKGYSTRIETQDGAVIPVSRRYSARVTSWAGSNLNQAQQQEQTTPA